MSPEKFMKIVSAEQAGLVGGPGEPLVVGVTDTGEQAAVIQGRHEGEPSSHFTVITAPDINPRHRDHTIEEIPTGARAVRYPSFDSGRRADTVIGLSDGRSISLPEVGRPLESGTVRWRLGSTIIKPLADYRQPSTDAV